VVVPWWEFSECGEGGDGDGGRLLGGPAGQTLEQLLGDERHERGYQPEHITTPMNPEFNWVNPFRTIGMKF
jgi:hypothetical protein